MGSRDYVIEHTITKSVGAGGIFYEGRSYKNERAYDVLENIKRKVEEIELGYRVTRFLQAENGSLDPGIKFIDVDDPNYKPIKISEEAMRQMDESQAHREKQIAMALIIMELRGESTRYTWLLGAGS